MSALASDGPWECEDGDPIHSRGSGCAIVGLGRKWITLIADGETCRARPEPGATIRIYVNL